MASNLETIGLGVADRTAFEQLVTGLAEAAREGLSTPVGDYAVWRSRSGAEVWLHIAPADRDGPDAVREIQGLTPFFDGTSDISLSVTERINRPDDNAFEGAYQAWVGDGGAPGTEGGNYPLVFDAVDFAAFSNQNLPAACRARICGFAASSRPIPTRPRSMPHRRMDQALLPSRSSRSACSPKRNPQKHPNSCRRPRPQMR